MTALYLDALVAAFVIIAVIFLPAVVLLWSAVTAWRDRDTRVEPWNDRWVR